MKVNNKGFTLVELLAVMVILITISLVSVSAVTESLVRRDIKECKEQQELAVSAAKMYFSFNSSSDSVVNSVTVGILKEQGYIKDGEKADKLNDTDKITIDVDVDKYLYCTEKCENVGDSCS